MLVALEEAGKAYEKREVPVGAVITNFQGDILSQAHNLTRTHKDPTSHAELIAIKRAALIGPLHQCVLYTTLEPCMMCFGAIIHANIKEVCYGSPSPLDGVFSNHLINELKYADIKVFRNILGRPSQELLSRFFKDLRSS